MSEVKLRLLRAAGAATAPLAEELLQRAGRGDEAAFGDLYDVLAPTVHGVAQRVVRDRAITEEVTQEVFVELWRVAPRFDINKGTARGWAATIAHRKAVDRVRSEQARRDREARDHHGSHQPDTDVVAETIERASDRRRVTDALAELTAVQREAVTLAYFGGHTYREVAALLDLPEGTVKTRIRDGLGAMRDKIGNTP